MNDLITHHRIRVNDFLMHYIRAGSGPPLVLLHGWPQSCYEWRRVIPPLAEHFTVIAPDLRGLGDSERPLSGYDKRTLASDVHALMKTLGHDKIGLIGHDWGGAVAYFLSYDHPAMVERLMILEMIPALGEHGGSIDLNTAKRLWHVFFHAGMPDLAVKLVSNDVRGYLSEFYTNGAYNYSPAIFAKTDIDEYVRVYSAPGALRAGFQYYRTGLDEDLVSMATCTRKLQMPVLAWGGGTFLGNIVPAWEAVAANVSGGAVECCGHFMPEERPEFVVAQALQFFGAR